MQLSLDRLLLVLIGVALAACTGPTPAPGTGEATPRTPSGSATSTPRTDPTSPASLAPSASHPAEEPGEPPPLALEEVAAGLDAPIGITSAPGGLLLVNERPGRVVGVDPENGSTSVVLDIRDRIRSGGEQGLLGLVLHPDWPQSLRAFAHYTGLDGETVIAEYRGENEPIALDPASERVLLRVEQPYANHNGGQLAFGPDGHLYVGLGDGGSGGDPHGHGQDPHTLLGSILRLDVNTPPQAGNAYAIPDGNPFDGSSGLEEIYILGVRNPWRFSFDDETGALWVADVGQNAFEEVTRLVPGEAVGANLGWNVMEASHCFADPACDPGAYVGPITEYGHDLGCSITGGHVYRGQAIAGLPGWYVFGDYCSGTIFGVPSTATALTPPRVLLEAGITISAFGQGADGTLYVADLEAGTISRLVADG